MILKILFFFIIFLSECHQFLNAKENLKVNYFLSKKIIENTINNWNLIVKTASEAYKVDEKLIKSIIYVESSGNPNVKSHSNAIGLMQIKPSSAGLEVYRSKGKKGQPSIQELYNPKTNINIGTAYINLLQNKNLIGIKNKDVLRCATIVSYVNGASALLKIFSENRTEAISIINTMKINAFCDYVKKNIHHYKHLVI